MNCAPPGLKILPCLRKCSPAFNLWIVPPDVLWNDVFRGLTCGAVGAAAARLQMPLLRQEASGFGLCKDLARGCGRHETRRRGGAAKCGGRRVPARQVAAGAAATLTVTGALYHPA